MIVTDAEVVEFVEDIEHVGVRERLIIDGIEQAVSQYCNRIFPSAVYTNEQISIAPAIFYGSILVHPQILFQIRNYPVTVWTSLKYVTSWGTDGNPSATSTLTRNLYHVEMDNGIVRLLNPLPDDSIVLGDSSRSFPQGPYRLLATYTGGYSSSAMPAALKLVILQAITRYHKIQLNNGWHISSLQSDLGTTAFLREFLTPEEKGLLEPFRRPAFATGYV